MIGIQMNWESQVREVVRGEAGKVIEQLVLGQLQTRIRFFSLIAVSLKDQVDIISFPIPICSTPINWAHKILEYPKALVTVAHVPHKI